MSEKLKYVPEGEKTPEFLKLNQNVEILTNLMAITRRNGIEAVKSLFGGI